MSFPDNVTIPVLVDAHLGDMIYFDGINWINVPAGIPFGATNIPTGRTATYVIAPTDATATEKAQADETLDQTADQTEINAAITAASTLGGKVVVLGGTVKTTGAIVMKANVILEFQGTEIRPQANVACISAADVGSWAVTGRWVVDYSDAPSYGATGCTNSACVGVSVDDTGAEATSRFVIEGGYIWYAYQGIKITDVCWGYTIRNTNTQMDYVNGLYINGGTGAVSVTIDGCLFLHTLGDSISITGIKALSLKSVGVTSDNARGFYIESCSGTLISCNGEGCHPATTHGVYHFSGSRMVLLGCTGYANHIITDYASLVYAADSSFIKCSGFKEEGDVGVNGNNISIRVQAGSKIEFDNSTLVAPTNGAIELGWDGARTRFTGVAGYIGQGEVRSASGALTGGAANAILFAWHNPEAQDIFIKRVILNLTAGDADAANIDVGIADDATYTNGGTEFFDDLTGETTGVYDSVATPTLGKQTVWVLCQDSASATDGWVVGKILTNDGTSIAGSYYIEYVGK
jgi:hypothetical protein